MDSKQALVDTFGTEIGGRLFGAAVKVSVKLGVDLDDFVQDLSITALAVQTEYGYVNINIAVKRAKAAIYNTYNYGVNRYYGEQGISELSVDESDNGDGENLIDLLTFDLNAIAVSDLTAEFAAILETVSAADRQVLYGLAGGWQAQEVAATLGKSNAWVSGAKKRLQAAFQAYAY